LIFFILQEVNAYFVNYVTLSLDTTVRSHRRGHNQRPQP